MCECYFQVSDAISTFFHPCEKKFLDDIVRIVNLLRDIAKFSTIYGTNQNINLNVAVDTDGKLFMINNMLSMDPFLAQ